MNNRYEDHLGNPRGDILFEHAPQAQAMVRKWRILSVGNRPKDHMIRDLLFATIQKDGRMWKFHSLLKNKPRWMCHDAVGKGMLHLRSVLRYRSLHFLHLLHLAELKQTATQDVVEKITTIEGCWPTTVEVVTGTCFGSPCKRAAPCSGPTNFRPA